MHTQNESHMRLTQKIIVFLLFLANMNFFQKSFYWIFLSFAFLLLSSNGKVKIDVGAVLLTIFSVAYILFSSSIRGDAVLMMKNFAYPLCYLIGLNFITQEDEAKYSTNKKESIITAATIIVGLGSFVNYALNMVINIGSSSRNTIDIWSGSIMSATGQALMAVTALCIFCALLFSAKTWLLRLTSVAGLLLIFSYNFVLHGRTLIIMFAIILLVAFLFVYNKNKRRLNRKSAIIIIAIFLLVSLYIGDAFGIRSIFESTDLFKRFEAEEIAGDSRFHSKLLYLKYLMQYPFGGSHIRSLVGQYAHDIYLDTYDEAGIIAAVFLIAFLIYTTIHTYKAVKNTLLSVTLGAVLTCVFLGGHLAFWIEPVLQGNAWIFAIFCFYQGLMNREYYLLVKKMEKNRIPKKILDESEKL